MAERLPQKTSARLFFKRAPLNSHIFNGPKLLCSSGDILSEALKWKPVDFFYNYFLSKVHGGAEVCKKN